MDATKVRRFREQIKRFRQRFAQGCTGALGNLLGQEELEDWLARHSAGCRDRIYSPLITLGMFVDQVMSADQSCQDAVARGVSARISQGEKPCGLNNGPYCKARQRLAPALLTELCDATGRRLVKTQPWSWRWRGREVKLIDGTTISMPDTAANQRAQGNRMNANVVNHGNSCSRSTGCKRAVHRGLICVVFCTAVQDSRRPVGGVLI